MPRFIEIGPVILKIFYFEIRQKYFCSIAIISPWKGTYVNPLPQEGTALCLIEISPVVLG